MISPEPIKQLATSWVRGNKRKGFLLPLPMQSFITSSATYTSDWVIRLEQCANMKRLLEGKEATRITTTGQRNSYYITLPDRLRRCLRRELPLIRARREC